MKKLFSVLCVLAIVLGFPVNSFALYIPQTEEVYDFSGGIYGVTEIDTDGKIFVGVRAGKLAVSEDFQSWKILKDTDDVTAVKYIGGKFCAVHKGYTLVSADGINWEKYENNLPATVKSCIKNKGSAVVFAEDMDEDYNKINTGTYQSFDGVNWKRVENIPEGAKMTIIGDKIVFASATYMEGIYASDTGESFTKLDIDGFKIGTGGMFMEYRDGEYVQNDIWREIDDESMEYAYFSRDLVNWETKIIPRLETLPHDSTYTVINGKSHMFTINGDDYVWDDGEWCEGEYDMGENKGELIGRPFLNYNVTENGILAWSSNKDSFFIDNDGVMHAYKGSVTGVMNVYAEDGRFYAAIKGSYNEDGTAVFSWQSADGVNWTYDAQKTVLWDNLNYYGKTASNGELTLESDIIERGSWRDYEGNKNLGAVITAKDGTQSRVVFEDTKGIDYVKMLGGNGWFIMSDNDDGWYFSRDGITRGEKIGLAGNLYSNGENFVKFDYITGIMQTGKMEQFDGLSMPDTMRIKLNDTWLSFVNPPIIEDGRVLVSLRFLFESMGAEVTWDDVQYKIGIAYGGNNVELKIDSDRAYVNGAEKVLDVPARLVNNKTMIPLRFVSEELGFDVVYNDADRSVEIH